MTYILDPAWHAEHARLENLASLYDPGTAAICDQLGVTAGWRCADLGAGTGTVVKILADRVGSEGEVLAVDADTRFLEPLAGGPISVLAADVTSEPLPANRFDLAHSRLLLEHLPAAETVIESMAKAVRPGGWVFVEDLDWTTAMAVDPPSEAHERIIRACHELFTGTPYDPSCGRKLPRLLRRAGLTDIGARSTALYLSADSAHGLPGWEMLVEQLAPRLLELGLLSQADLDAFHQLWHDGDSICFGPLMVSAWGRRKTDDERLE
ncbi:methyltransferase domain-containing protein [Saccharopolyspora shandongensis]|uniref:methyltransferase domain-containing protein n=1 Tax=Saccharopolyspora shandongensis TaxID=418495 RepID=UPI003436ED5D